MIGVIGVTALWRVVREPSTDRRPARSAPQTVQASVATALLGDLSERRGGREVQELARRVAADYREFHAKLQSLAATEGSALPPRLDLEDRARLEYFSLEREIFDSKAPEDGSR